MTNLMISCDLCGSTETKLLFLNYDRMFFIKERVFRVVQCTGCGLIRLADIPTEEETKSFYPANYKPFQLNPGDSAWHANIARAMYDEGFVSIPRRAIFFLAFRLRLNRSIPQPTLGARLLDIGCGSGAFLMIAKRLGYDAYGVEPSFSNDRLANSEGLHIYKGFLQDVKFKNDFFDVVTLNHVIEHTPKPSEVLRDVSRIVKPGGKIIIALPNSHSVGFWVFGKYWLNTDTPRHIYLFSVKNMIAYAKKVGFEIERINFTTTPGSFIESLRYVIGALINRPFSFHPIISKAMVVLLFLPTEALNIFQLGDHMEFVFKKLN